jgi:hypothetical protein
MTSPPPRKPKSQKPIESKSIELLQIKRGEHRKLQDNDVTVDTCHVLIVPNSDPKTIKKMGG